MFTYKSKGPAMFMVSRPVPLFPFTCDGIIPPHTTHSNLNFASLDDHFTLPHHVTHSSALLGYQTYSLASALFSGL